MTEFKVVLPSLGEEPRSVLAEFGEFQDAVDWARADIEAAVKDGEVYELEVVVVQTATLMKVRPESNG